MRIWRVSRGFTPGWWSWPYRPESQSERSEANQGNHRGARIVPRPGLRFRFVMRAIWGPGVLICELRGSSSHPRLNLPLTGEISQRKLGTILRSGCIRKRVPRDE